MVQSGSSSEGAIVSGTDDARYVLPLSSDGEDALTATNPAQLLSVDRAMISTLLVWAHSSDTLVDSPSLDGEEMEFSPETLRSGLLASIPTANVQLILSHLETIRTSSGEQVIREGDTGNHYYIIQPGECEVTRQTDKSDQPVRLTTLHSGDSFGEEAIFLGPSAMPISPC